MRAHRIAAAAAGGALGLMAATPLVSWADTSAPVGSASGTNLTLGSSSSPIVSVSSTSAQAGSGSSGSSATVLSLGGNTIVGGQSGTDNSSGNVADTGAGNPVRVQVAPYSARATQPKSGSSSAESNTSVAEVTAGPASVGVLRSHSKADYTTAADGTSTQSGGSNSTDGAVIDASGLYVDLLHSDANSSNGQSNAYLADINGNYIGTRQQLSAICQSISIPSTLSLGCDQATGGVGGVFARVLGANIGPDQGGLPIEAFASSGAGAGKAVGGVISNPVITASAGQPAPLASAPAGNPGSTSGNLPFTGAPITLWVFGSVALLALGGVAVKASAQMAPRLFA